MMTPFFMPTSVPRIFVYHNKHHPSSCHHRGTSATPLHHTLCSSSSLQEHKSKYKKKTFFEFSTSSGIVTTVHLYSIASIHTSCRSWGCLRYLAHMDLTRAPLGTPAVRHMFVTLVQDTLDSGHDHRLLNVKNAAQTS